MDYASNERMIQKKVLGARMKQRRITGRSCSRTSVSTILSALLLAGLSSIEVISSCVISPSESVAIAGDRISFSCNARPNNQERGSIQFIKLGSDGASGTEIFRPPVYGPGSRIITKLSLADGYFLSQLDESHSNVTIQINETQLKNGGQYFCTCVESTSTLGTANFTVLDKLSFVRNVEEALTPGSPVDLNCSVSFNGSTSSAFIDLTISDANGTQVSSGLKLPLISNVNGYHMILSKVVCDPKEVQRFTCEVKVWNKSSIGESPLHSKSSNISLICDPKSTASQKPGRASLITVGVIAAFLVVAVFISIFIYMKFYKRSITNGTVLAHEVGQRTSTANQNIRYNDAKLSIQHPPHMDSEDKKQRNHTMPAHDVVVFENDIYEASSGIDPADCHKTEQIYDQVL